MGIAKHLTGLVVAFGLVSACSQEEPVLPGERFDVRDRGADAGLAIVDGDPGADATIALRLPAPATNSNWTHPGGSEAHTIPHPSLDRSLDRVWSVSIGDGTSRGHRLTADPVVSDGRVFAMDSRSMVSAVTTTGQVIWTRSLTPASDRDDDASSGGIAVAGNTLYATTGFGTLWALDATSGAVRWTQDLDSMPTGAPLVDGGRVFVTTRDGTGWAIDTTNGRLLWEVLGRTSDGGLVGGAGPALAGPLVIFPFSSGQMVAAGANTGAVSWAASVGGRDRTRAFSAFGDFAGPPVVSDTHVYGATHAGRLTAVSLSSGRADWSADVGAVNPIWLGGNSLFFVSPENVLTRLDAESGQTVWQTPLALFEARRASRIKSTFVHYGPVLAGGRLIVASDDGVLREFDPVAGELIRETDLGNGLARNPVVAGGVLYLVTQNGQLHAFR